MQMPFLILISAVIQMKIGLKSKNQSVCFVIYQQNAIFFLFCA